MTPVEEKEKKCQTDIEDLCLAKSPTLFATTCFSVDAIYLSSICAAVLLKPKSGCVSREEEKGENTWSKKAKTELYRILRKTYQIILEYGAVYPVAGILNATPPEQLDTVAMRSWSSDQEWHRGGFTLYVEEERPYGRLVDLLLPLDSTESFLSKPQERVRTLSWYQESMITERANEENQKEENTQTLYEKCNRIFLELADLPAPEQPFDLKTWDAHQEDIRKIVKKGLNQWHTDVIKSVEELWGEHS